eukprot:5551516-Lingulodinium_polyedra.AAC.1
MLKAWLQACSGQERADLRAWSTHDLNHRIVAGSICSGTEASILCWKAFSTASEEESLGRLEVAHGFGREVDKEKQAFIRILCARLTFPPTRRSCVPGSGGERSALS